MYSHAEIWWIIFRDVIISKKKTNSYDTFHSRPENLKKSRQKNLWNKINQNFFSWNCIFGSFKLVSRFKNWFLAIFEIAKMELGEKKFFFRQIDLFDFTSFFLAWTFLSFLAPWTYVYWLYITHNILVIF